MIRTFLFSCGLLFSLNALSNDRDSLKIFRASRYVCSCEKDHKTDTFFVSSKRENKGVSTIFYRFKNNSGSTTLKLFNERLYVYHKGVRYLLFDLIGDPLNSEHYIRAVGFPNMFGIIVAASRKEGENRVYSMLAGVTNVPCMEVSVGPDYSISRFVFNYGSEQYNCTPIETESTVQLATP